MVLQHLSYLSLFLDKLHRCCLSVGGLKGPWDRVGSTSPTADSILLSPWLAKTGWITAVLEVDWTQPIDRFLDLKAILVGNDAVGVDVSPAYLPSGNFVSGKLA